MAIYDSGGKHQDQKKYADNYERIFGCKECKMKDGQHKMDCSRGRMQALDDQATIKQRSSKQVGLE